MKILFYRNLNVLYFIANHFYVNCLKRCSPVFFNKNIVILRTNLLYKKRKKQSIIFAMKKRI